MPIFLSSAARRLASALLLGPLLLACPPSLAIPGKAPAATARPSESGHGRQPGAGIETSPEGRAGDGRAGDGLVRSDRRTGVLANGLAYFVERGGHPGEKLSINLVVRVGHLQDPEGETQVAHVLEHIVMPGAAAQNISVRATLARFGGVWGSDANAGTGNSFTHYHVNLPAGDPAAFEAGLAILGAWISPRALTDAEIDRETRVVIEEVRRGGSDGERMQDFEQRATWFADRPDLAMRPDKLGTSSVTPPSVRAMYARYYSPRNMAVVIVGDIDPDAVVRSLTSGLAAIPSRPPVPAPPAAAVPALAGGHYRALGDPASETVAEISYKYRRAPSGSPAALKEAAIAAVLERIVSVPFGHLAERYSAPVMGGGLLPAYPGNAAAPFGTEILSVRANLRPGMSREGLFELLRLAATLRRGGFPESEFGRIRTDLMAAIPDGAPTASSIAGRWVTWYGEGLYEPWPAEVRRELAALRLADVEGALTKWLNPRNRDIFLRHGDEPGVPGTTDIADIVARAERAEPVSLARPALREPVLDALDIVDAPAPAAQREAHGYLRWTLPASGATLLFRQTGNDRTSLLVRRKGGGARYDGREATAAMAASDVVERSGLGGLDTFEIRRFLADRQITVSPSVGLDREGVRGSAPASEWPLLLRLARAQLFAPECREAAFREYQGDLLRQQRANGGAWAGAFDAMMDAAIGYPSRPAIDDLEAFRRDDLCRRYKTMFADTKDMVIVVEGKLTPAEVHAGIAAAFDRTPVAGAERYRPRPRDTETHAGRSILRQGSKDAAKVVLTIGGAARGDPRLGSLAAIILQDRLYTRLRETERGTYAVSAGFSDAFAPDYVAFSVAFECAPASMDRMIAAAKGEIERYRREGPSDAELASARALSPAPAMGGDDPAEAWIKRGTLADDATPLTDAAVRAWGPDFLDPSRLHEFVLLPGEATGAKR